MAALRLSVYALQIMFLLFTSAASAALQGFTTNLIRQDSSKLRLRSGSPFSDTFAASGEFAMKLKIGTPPFEIASMADTGSDIIWTQCLPCKNCYKQDTPLFDPAKSSTFRDLPCGSSQCPMDKARCDANGSKCPFAAIYDDVSLFSFGNAGVDTLTLQSTSGHPFVLRKTIFGCGYNNSFYSPQMSGIIGLGWGPTSLISQMGDTIQGLFSYCLGAGTSKINFGANAIVSGDGTVSTKLFKKQAHPSNYFLNLEAVSVGQSRVETWGTSFASKDGNIVIDSGTTWTFLPQDYYLRVKKALARAIKAEGVDPPADFSRALCYKSENLEDFPEITMHFTGANLVLGRSNTYVKAAPGVICLIVTATHDRVTLPILGNRAQFDFLVNYDTRSRKISFKPTNCNA